MIIENEKSTELINENLEKLINKKNNVRLPELPFKDRQNKSRRISVPININQPTLNAICESEEYNSNSNNSNSNQRRQSQGSIYSKFSDESFNVDGLDNSTIEFFDLKNVKKSQSYASQEFGSNVFSSNNKRKEQESQDLHNVSASLSDISS